MKASEYLEQLQRCIRLSEAAKAQTHTISSMWRRAKDNAMGLLTEDELSRLPDLAFGAIPTLEGNAWAISVPGGGVAICIDLLLPSCLWTLARAIWDFDDAELRSYSNPMMQARVSWITAKWFLTRDFRYALLLQEWKDGLHKQSERAISMVLGMVDVQLQFLVLHEIGHVLLGHLDRTKKLTLGQEQSPDKISCLRSDLEVLDRNILQEFRADEYAAKALGRSDFLRSVGALSMCDTMFLFIHSLEILSEPTSAQTTHPKSRDRLDRMRREFEAGGQMKRWAPSELLDSYFEIQDRFFVGIPDSMWMQSSGIESFVEQWTHQATEGNVETFVTVGGDLSIADVTEIVMTANSWLVPDDLVNIGIVCPSETGLSMTLTQGVAAVACWCTKFYQTRKNAFSEGRWNPEFLRQSVQQELIVRCAGKCECINAVDFNQQFQSDGEVCKIVVAEQGAQSRCLLALSAATATFTLTLQHI